MAAAAGAFSFASRKARNMPPPLPRGAALSEYATALLQTSPDELERKHVFCGLIHDCEWDNPLLLSRDYFANHAIVLGSTGAGKTTRFVLPAIKALLAMRCASIVYTAFRRDWRVVWALVKIATDLGIPVDLITTVRRLASQVFNIMLDKAWILSDPSERAQMILAAAGMAKGEAHGKGFWADMNAKILRDLFAGLPELRSFREYDQALKDPQLRARAGITAHQIEQASHAVDWLDRTALVRAANYVPGDPVPPSVFDNRFSTDKLLAAPRLVIAYFPALTQLSEARTFFRLMQRLIIARLMQWTGPRVANVLMFGDDVSPAIEMSLGNILRDSRGLGLGTCWIAQNLDDFLNDDCDMRQTLLNNASLHVFFSARDREGRSTIYDASGEVVKTLKGSGMAITDGPSGQAVSMSTADRETICFRHGPNELNMVNANAGLAIVSATPKLGYTQLDHPVIASLPHCMEKSEYDELPDEWAVPNGISLIVPDQHEHAPPAPVPAPAPVAPSSGGTKKKRPPKKPDPEQQRRGQAIRDRLRDD
jgi:hypothetical protein